MTNSKKKKKLIDIRSTKSVQIGFFRAKVADFGGTPLAYGNPVALHGVTRGTMRLLPDESLKTGGEGRLGLRWSSVCVRVDK